MKPPGLASIVGALLFIAPPAWARDASGTVLDPQDLPVPGVVVRLACGARHESTRTDRLGAFRFTDVQSEDCWIDIERRGFDPVHQAAAAAGAEHVIRLRLADVRETVTVVAPPDASRKSALTSVELADEDLRSVAGSTRDLIRYARLMAGATSGATVVYVDGLPTAALPPIDLVASISVNRDPFSAEFGDGDVTGIRITTKAPARAFRFNSGTDFLGLGGRNILNPEANATAQAANVGVRGAIPGLPITFSTSVSHNRTSDALSIEAVTPHGAPVSDAGVASVNRSTSGSLDLYYASPGATRASASYREFNSRSDNLGVGGLVLPESGYSSAATNRDVRATFNRRAGGVAHEGGISVSTIDMSTRANSDALGIVISGDAVLGGAMTTSSSSERTRWTSRYVARSSTALPWAIGVWAAGAVDADRQNPNQRGVFQVNSLDAYGDAMAGRPTGTWFVSRGNGDARYSNLLVSPFVQKTLLRTSAAEINGGVRADYHSDFGTIVSPRLSFAARTGAFTIAGGAGQFALPVTDAIFLRAIENDGRHLQQLIATGVSLDAAELGEGLDRQPDATASITRMSGIRSSLAPGLARPRQWMERISIERPFGRLVPGFEATWTQDRRLFGSERVTDGDGWLDVVESNRRANRVRLQGQLRYTRTRATFVGHYQWSVSHDDGDGAFSFPEVAGDLAREWARSAGVAPHTVSVVGSVRLPGGVTMNVTDSWSSGAPYNITSGGDVLRNGLFVDRGGRPRNDGDGPGSNTLSLYGFRRLPLPEALVRGRFHLNLGVQADNILDNRNYQALGSVAGSSTFGRPLLASAGRSVRVYFNVD